jgi:hypothetical protein
MYRHCFGSTLVRQMLSNLNQTLGPVVLVIFKKGYQVFAKAEPWTEILLPMVLSALCIAISKSKFSTFIASLVAS